MIKDVPHRANLYLQILLFFNVYLSSTWVSIYGVNICQNISALWTFHGRFIVLGYFLATIVEVVRLYKGYSGNLRAKAEDLSIFLLLAPLVQLPVMLFLLLSTKTYIAIISIVTYTIIGVMCIEFFIGIFVWRKHSYHQAKLYQFMMQTNFQSQTEIYSIK